MKLKINLVFILIACMLAASCSNSKKKNIPVPLTSGSKVASCLSLAASPNGSVIISWAQKSNKNSEIDSFYFAKWNEKKDTFSAPIAVPLEPNTSFNDQNKPFLVFQTPDSVWVIYSVNAPTKGKQYASFIHYRISGNSGQSWSQPKSLLNDTIPGKSRSFANAIRLPNGKIAFAWMGNMPNMKEISGRALYYATTSGNGLFSTPVLIDSFACPCCRNSLSVAPNGKVAIAYRSVRKDNIRDIAFSCKPAGTDTFSKPVIPNDDHWQLNACPEDGPSLVVTNQENWIGWFTGGNNQGIYYAKIDNNGKVLYKKKVEQSGRYIRIVKIPDGKNAVIYNSVMKMEGMEVSTIKLSKTGTGLLPSEELDTANYYAARPVIIPVQNGEDLLTAWIAKDRVWYKKVE